MPTYLLHGFRWSRASIRIHIILQDLEDAAAEWIVAPATSITLLNSFYSLYDFLPPSNPPPLTYQPSVPHDKVLIQDDKQDEAPKLLSRRNMSVKGLRRISSAAMLMANGKRSADGKLDFGKDKEKETVSRPMTSAPTSSTTSMSVSEAAKLEKKPMFNDWSVVKLVEQYDPDDLTSVSQPYAYVADHMVEISLSASLAEEMEKYEQRIRAEGELINGCSTTGGQSTATNEPGGDRTTHPLSPREQRRRVKRLGWLEKLRDGLDKDSTVGWFLVVCGDEERVIPDLTTTTTTTSQLSLVSEVADSSRLKTPTRSSFSRLFSRRRSAQEVKA